MNVFCGKWIQIEMKKWFEIFQQSCKLIQEINEYFNKSPFSKEMVHIIIIQPEEYIDNI